jgi:hypothetical protein
MTDLSPAAQRHFAQKHMDDAAKLAGDVYERLAAESEENRRTYERFYNNLALFSGGTLALSVTFLGYLKSTPKPIAHERWLIASWISLFVCLTLSLFWTLFVTHYGHYSRNREYAEAAKTKHETEAKEIQYLDVVNIRTPAELDAFIVPRREAALKSGKNAKWNEAREKFYYPVWIWSGRLARLGFIVGMGFLILVAIKNI